MAFIRLLTYDPGRDPGKMKVRYPQSVFKKLVKGFVSEFIGTLFLCFFCSGSVTTAFYVPNGDMVSRFLLISTIQGFCLAAIIYAISGISGCNLNPAVTFANLMSGRTGLLNAIVFIAAQILGSLAGVGILYGVIPWEFHHRLGVTRLGPGVGTGNGFLIEMMLTALLCLVVLGTSVFNVWDRRMGRIAPFAIGMALFAGVGVGLPFTGGSLNPVRTFAPSVIAGSWSTHWIYWLGPIVGGFIAAYIFRVLLQTRFDVCDRPGYVPIDQSQLKGAQRW